MDEFQPKKYLRIQTGVVVTVQEVKHDTDKNVVTVVMADESGALIDSRFQLDGDYAKMAASSMTKIKTLLKISSLKDAVGHKLGIHINRGADFIYKKGPKAGQTGVSYNVSGFFNPKNLESPKGENKDEFTEGTTDEIPF